MENLILKAREFVERVLSNDKNKVGKEHYYMFLISKFLLLKEYMIKKDAKNNILYFDYKKNKKYIPTIKYIVDYIKEHGEILKNSTRVEIKNNTSNDELESYIWIFNKIRDSFAHGMYSLDLENEQIIINNDHSSESDPYVLKCSLPVEILEFFTYYGENHTNRSDIDHEVEYKKYISKIRSDFSIPLNYKVDIVKDYNNYINSNEDTYNLYKVEYFERKDFVQKMGFKNILFNNDKFKHLNNSYLKYEEIFDTLIILIENSKDLSASEKERLLKYLESLGLIDKKNPIKKKIKTDKKYLDKLVCVIEEMSNILGLKNSSKNILVIPALYNYMQLAFSFIDTKNMDKSSLGYLRLSKINPCYIKMEENVFGERGFVLNKESQYSLKCSAIERQCESFISVMNEKLVKYDSNQKQSFRHALMDNFTKFYNDIILSFTDKNSFIISSLRNSVEHANINDFNGYIILNDKSNQDDAKTINFSCYTKPNDLYMITKSIEMGTSKDEFTIGDFLGEIKYVVSNEVYTELLVVLQKMSNIIFGKDLEMNYHMEKMYIEAVANVINSGIQKR